MAYNYTNLDCSGTADQSFEFCAESEKNGYECISTCGEGGCDYLAVTIYDDVTGCNDDDTPSGYNISYVDIAVMNYCDISSGNGLEITSNDTHILRNEYSSTECSEDPSNIVASPIGSVCVFSNKLYITFWCHKI